MKFDYEYDHVSVAGLNNVRAEPRLTAIEYSQNQAAGIPAHARVEMDWWTVPKVCGTGSTIPIGARVTGRRGSLELEGASWLARVRVFVRKAPGAGMDTLVHEWNLSYDSQAYSCTSDHSPLRVLQSITEYAFRDGVQQSKPPVTFEYGALYTPRSHPKSLKPTTKLTHLGAGERLGRLQKPYSDWPGVSAQLMDYDGDGRLDLMYQTPSTSSSLSLDKKQCKGRAYLDVGTGDRNREFSLPTIPWGGSGRTDPEGCTLSAQFTERTYRDYGGTGINGTDPVAKCPVVGNYLAYRWMDLDGDGDQDLVAALQYDPLMYNPLDDPALAAASDYPACPPQPCSDCVSLTYAPGPNNSGDDCPDD